MDAKNRLKKAYDYLKSKGIVHTQLDVAKAIGSGKENVSRAFNGYEKYLTESFLERFNTSFGDLFNLNWLKTGEGEMLKSGIKYDFAEKLPQNTNGVGVPYFEDIESSGGIIPSMNENGRETPTFFINYEHFNDCTAYIQHVGDSMYPKYCSGEIIAVKRIFNFDVVLWGEAYLVVTNDNANSLCTVKLLHQHDDDSKVILRASNPNFKGDTIIRKEDIISLFMVKGKITRNQL